MNKRKLPQKQLKGVDLLTEKPVAEDVLTRSQFSDELQKGIDSMAESRSYTADEVDAMLNKEFGI